MHEGKLLASWRRNFSLAVHVAHADNVLRGLSTAADGVEATSSSDDISSRATAFFTRAMGGKRPCASSRNARSAACRLDALGFYRCVDSRVFSFALSSRCVHNHAMPPFAVPWITLPSCNSCPLGRFSLYFPFPRT
jgi:hypothetical protein